MSLLEDNLRKSPEERLRENSRFLAMEEALKQAMAELLAIQERQRASKKSKP